MAFQVVNEDFEGSLLHVQPIAVYISPGFFGLNQYVADLEISNERFPVVILQRLIEE